MLSRGAKPFTTAPVSWRRPRLRLRAASSRPHPSAKLRSTCEGSSLVAHSNQGRLMSQASVCASESCTSAVLAESCG